MLIIFLLSSQNGEQKMLTSACGFFDEWHKQFIAGRHFDADETLLNIACGILGVLLAFAASLWMLRRKNRKRLPDTTAGN